MEKKNLDTKWTQSLTIFFFIYQKYCVGSNVYIIGGNNPGEPTCEVFSFETKNSTKSKILPNGLRDQRHKLSSFGFNGNFYVLAPGGVLLLKKDLLSSKKRQMRTF